MQAAAHTSVAPSCIAFKMWLRVALVAFKMWQRLILRGLQRLPYFSQRLQASTFLNTFQLWLFSTAFQLSHFFFNASSALPLFPETLQLSLIFCKFNFPQLFSSVQLVTSCCSVLTGHGKRLEISFLLFFFRLNVGQPWCKMRQHGSKVNISNQFILSNISQCWKILSGCFFQIKLLVKVFQVFQVWCCFPTFRLLLFQAGIGARGRWTAGCLGDISNCSNEPPTTLNFCSNEPCPTLNFTHFS